MIEASKSELREQASASRLSPGQASGLSKAVADCLIGCPDWQRARVILAYRSLPGEVGIDSIATYAAVEGKTVYYPRVDGGRLIFHRPVAGERYRRGGLGVEEPDPAWPTWNTTETEPVLVLVPALRFDRRGYRLGRGAGYYDRFTAQTRRRLESRVCFGGLCFSRNLLAELPEDPWDEPMDWVLTEAGFVSP